MHRRQTQRRKITVILIICLSIWFVNIDHPPWTVSFTTDTLTRTHRQRYRETDRRTLWRTGRRRHKATINARRWTRQRSGSRRPDQQHLVPFCRRGAETAASAADHWTRQQKWDIADNF